MKTYRFALLMLGAVVAACTNKEIVEPQQGEAEKVVHFTATLAPKGEGSSRAITSGTDENGKEILNVKWANSEQIAIYYQKNDGSYATATATVGTPNDDGSAPFTATFTNPKDGGEAKLVYPATLADNGEINTFGLQNNQCGLMLGKIVGYDSYPGISKFFDAATGKGIISVSGSTATINGNVGMKNEVCICKFNLNINNPDASVNYYDISIAFDGGYTYNLSTIPKDWLSSLYVAMLPVSSAKATITANGNKSNMVQVGASPLSIHRAVIPSVTLTAGKFYRNVPVTMNRWGNFDLRDGSITVGDGSIITSGGEQTPNTLTIVDGATVTLRDVNIETSAFGSPAGILCEGNATIILEGTNIINCGISNKPAIQAGPKDKTLTISGSGSLTVQGGVKAAGIGCGQGGICGDITITGGTIEAKGGVKAPGIGCGMDGGCGDITITNTVTRVTAYKGTDAPYSIGCGSGDGVCGTITIGGTNYGNQGISTNPFTYQPQ